VTTQRGAETRRQLLEAAGRVFAVRGYARATTKEIAKVAGVAEGTIYRHFADKQDLFYATFSAKSAVTADVFLRLPELAGKETVRENLRRFISVIEDIERTIAPLQASIVAAPVRVRGNRPTRCCHSRSISGPSRSSGASTQRSTASGPPSPCSLFPSPRWCSVVRRVVILPGKTRTSWAP
jgi:AcrR family transcriptional regulator